MKISVFLATILVLVCLAKASKTNLSVQVFKGNNVIIEGELSIVFHGVENEKVFTFDKTEFKKATEIILGSTDSMDDLIEKIEIKWTSPNDDKISIGFLQTETGSDYKQYFPEAGYRAEIASGDSIFLVN